MRRNVAGQKIGAQMVSASDGSAFTGSVTAHVTVDAGDQAAGSVGAGACAHEGNGYHTYAPAQAETDGALLAFTFTGTGAVPATVQVETVSFDPHDTVRLGLTALPNAAADAAGGIPAAKLSASAAGIITGTAVAGTLSTTEMTTDLTETTNDHFNGRAVVWTSEPLAGQARTVTGYDGTTKKLTFSMLTDTVPEGAAFVIV